MITAKDGVGVKTLLWRGNVGTQGVGLAQTDSKPETEAEGGKEKGGAKERECRGKKGGGAVGALWGEGQTAWPLCATSYLPEGKERERDREREREKESALPPIYQKGRRERERELPSIYQKGRRERERERERELPPIYQKGRRERERERELPSIYQKGRRERERERERELPPIYQKGRRERGEGASPNATTQDVGSGEGGGALNSFPLSHTRTPTHTH